MIQSELSRLKQNSFSVSDYSLKIENLIADLNYLQITQQGSQHKEIIVKINDEIGLHAFKSGLNDSLTNIVFAARPATLNEAINLALESEVPSQGTSQVLAYNHRKNYEKDKKYPNSNKFCNYCKRKGHEIKDCYKKKRVETRKVNVMQNSENYDVPETDDSGN